MVTGTDVERPPLITPPTEAVLRTQKISQQIIEGVVSRRPSFGAEEAVDRVELSEEARNAAAVEPQSASIDIDTPETGGASEPAAPSPQPVATAQSAPQEQAPAPNPSAAGLSRVADFIA